MPTGREELEAYLKLRRLGKPVTIRGFQRLMGYSSPGQAERMLKRLERLGLVEKTPMSEYIAKENLPPELSSYIIIKGYVLPRALIYSAYATTVIVTYTVLARPPPPAAILLLALVIPYWIETAININMLKKIRESEKQQ
jgi:hypothetical protein